MYTLEFAASIFMVFAIISAAYIIIAGTVHISDHISERLQSVQALSVSASALYMVSVVIILHLTYYIFYFNF